MTVLWSIIGLLLLIVWGITVVDIVRAPLGRGRTAAWIIIVLLVPFIGALLYWALRKPPADETGRAIAAEREMRHGAEHPPSRSGRIGP